MHDSRVIVPAAALSSAVLDSGFDARWVAWQTRGAAHEHAVRTRLLFALPLLACGLAAALHLFAR